MGSNVRKRVMVVCMFDSVHSARWLSQFQDQEIDFLLFPSSPHRRIHPNLKALLATSTGAQYKLFPGSRIFGLPLWIADKFVGNALRGGLLKQGIQGFKPQILHALELQNAGYVAARALKSGKPQNLKFVATNWGSDIFWFRQFPKHEKQLRALLSIADAYSCECNRDVELAKQLGFEGEVMPVIPNAGGFSEQDLLLGTGPLLGRKVIAVKGYHGWVGRAKVAVEAIESLSADLKDFEIVFYSANKTTERAAKAMAKRTGLNVQVNGKGKLSHKQVLQLFSQAKIYVGLSLSDGISTSLLESMAMGAIPVQTSTACCDEWFTDTGVAVREIAPKAVANAILEGLELAKNQSNADRNREAIRTKAYGPDVAAIARKFYD